ncbi:MAG: UvrD-helicase domain-containing protein, partial [Armatimonadota bacterium]
MAARGWRAGELMGFAGLAVDAALELRDQLRVGPFEVASDDCLLEAFRLRGYRVEELAGSDPLLAGAEGVLDREAATVWVRSDLDPSERRFVLAHELGHLMVHGAWRDHLDEPAVEASSTFLLGYSPAERRERDANGFASCFMAPRELALRAIAEEGSAERAALRLGIPRHALIRSALLPKREAATGRDFDGLDPSQHAAATAESGPIVVHAGPGTGKTSALVGRVKWLLERGSTTPERILILTFSRSATAAIDVRLAPLAAGDGVPIASTFHAYALDLIRRHDPRYRKSPPWIATTSDLRRAAATEFDRIGLDRLVHKSAPWMEFADWLSARVGAGAPTLGWSEDDWTELGRFHVWLDDWKHRANALAFDDLLPRAVALFDVPDVAEVESSRWDAVLVDETQDLDPWQWQLAERVAGGTGAGLWMVGDPNQSIYGFRGAGPPNRRGSENDSAWQLARNYRSLPGIVDAAEACLGTSGRWRSVRTGAAVLRHAFAEDDDAQTEGIAAIAARVGSEKTFAILCRTRLQAKRLVDSLRDRGVDVTSDCDDAGWLEFPQLKNAIARWLEAD